MSEIFSAQNLAFFGEAVQSTLIVTIVSTLLAYLIGVPLGILLYGTSKNGIFPNRAVNGVVGFVSTSSVQFLSLYYWSSPSRSRQPSSARVSETRRSSSIWCLPQLPLWHV